MSLAGPTNLQHLLPNLRERQQALGIGAPSQASARSADAASRLRQPGPQPRFHLVYAANNTNDRRFAQDLGHPLPAHVSVEALPDSDAHNVLIPLVERGGLASLLLKLVTA